MSILHIPVIVGRDTVLVVDNKGKCFRFHRSRVCLNMEVNFHVFLEIWRWVSFGDLGNAMADGGIPNILFGTDPEACVEEVYPSLWCCVNVASMEKARE